jgi:hypothetical protein
VLPTNICCEEQKGAWIESGLVIWLVPRDTVSAMDDSTHGQNWPVSCRPYMMNFPFSTPNRIRLQMPHCHSGGFASAKMVIRDIPDPRL